MSYLNEGCSSTEQKEVATHMFIIPYPVAHACHASLQKNTNKMKTTNQNVQTVQTYCTKCEYIFSIE